MHHLWPTRPIAFGLLLVCAISASGNDHVPAARSQTSDSISPFPFGHSQSLWIDDQNVVSASFLQNHDNSCLEDDGGLGAGDADQPNSCIDWFLPRSNVPFPMMEHLAEGRDIVLPLPMGTSFIWTEMDRSVAVQDVRLGLGSNPPTSVERIAVPETSMHASSQVARVDLWVLPCLNLYGIVGHTRSTGDVAVTINQFPLPGSPPITLNVPVDLRGPTAGFGATAGIGGKGWMATLDVNKTWTAFSTFDSSLTALVVTPRVGRIFDGPLFQGEIHVGAMWQDTAQTVELTIDHPILGNGLNVEADQYEPNPWNFLVGGLWAIDERVQLLVEGGMGGRSYILGGLTIRF